MTEHEKAKSRDTTEAPQQEELRKPMRRLREAERARLCGAPSYTLAESRSRIEAILNRIPERENNRPSR